MLNFVTHAYELKLKLYYVLFSFLSTFITSYLLTPQIINLLSMPFIKFVKPEDSDFIFTNVFEVFNTYVMLAFYVSLFLNLPVIWYFLLSFVKPGLFVHEKLLLYYFSKTTLKFLIVSFFFSYYILFPCILSFLLNLDVIINVDYVVLKMQTKLYDYIIFVCRFFLIYCFLIFQIPTLISIFVYSKQPKPLFFYTKRRFWILFSFILGCLFSSPDLLSLFLVTVPLLLFFESIIFTSILKSIYKNFLYLESCLNGKRQVC
jgi:sec-independent protein translocase protein TatC